MANSVTILDFSVSSGRTVQVRWSWNKNGETDYYKLRWHESWGAGYAASSV